MNKDFDEYFESLGKRLNDEYYLMKDGRDRNNPLWNDKKFVKWLEEYKRKEQLS